MDPTMTAEKLDTLRLKIEPWLPTGATPLSERGLQQCLRALTHRSASAQWNKDVPATCGDKHLSSCLATIFERRYPDASDSGQVTTPITAFVNNDTLKGVLETSLQLRSQDVIVGPDYPFAELNRSKGGMGDVFEAIFDAVMKDKGYDVAVAFAEKLLDAYCTKENKEFKDIKLPDSISRVNQKIQSAMPGCNPQAYLILQQQPTQATAEEMAKGNFVGWAHIKGAPPHTKKGPAYGRDKQECKEKLCKLLDEDSDLTNFFQEKQGQREPKKGALKAGASLGAAGAAGTGELVGAEGAASTPRAGAAGGPVSAAAAAREAEKVQEKMARQ